MRLTRGPAAAGALALALAVVSACARAPARPGGDVVSVVVSVDPAAGIDLGGLRWQPEGAAAPARRRGGSRVELAVRGAPRELRLEHPELCPLVVPLGEPARGTRVDVTMVAWIDPGPDQPQAGFDASFEVTVTPGCDAARAGTIEWRQLEGPPLAGLAVEPGGFVVRGRTHPLATFHPDPPPAGVVPLSPATRGAYALEARWRGDGHAEVRRVVRVFAAARAGGVPGVATGQRVLLGGAGWRVVGTPPGGAAVVEVVGGLATFQPDAPGRWQLAGEGGASLVLRAGRHDETPLDCGRAECHPNETRLAAATAMTTVLARGLDGALGASYDPRCAAACHAVGEPGTSDGGFAHVAAELDFALPGGGGAGGWAVIPPALRRLGGVGCTACHGPGAIPETAQRWTVLASDVCAVCHDAPPAYDEVAAWRRSRMARSDADPATRAGACGGCHTTGGFLATLGVRTPAGDTPARPLGIACAACHGAHAEGTGPALVRAPSPAATICVPCHAPTDDGQLPGASAAALVAGTGGIEIATGAPLALPGGHAPVAGGCTGCHRPHDFAASPAACAACHAGGPPPASTAITTRARALLARLDPASARATPGRPPHAGGARPRGDTPRGRALHDLLLVLEDPAASAHNAPYATRLLDEVDRWLAREPAAR